MLAPPVVTCVYVDSWWRGGGEQVRTRPGGGVNLVPVVTSSAVTLAEAITPPFLPVFLFNT